LIKKNDPGVPSIECTINGYSFQKTLYDTGSDFNIMAVVTYHLLHGTMPLQPTYIQLQMILRSLTWEKTSTIHPSPLEDCSLAPLKQSDTLEPEKSTCISPLRRYATILLTLTIYLKTLSRLGQEEDNATATREGKSSRTDEQTTKEKW